MKHIHITKPTILVILLALFLPLTPSGAQHAQETSRTFVETGKTISGLFLRYWDSCGGLAQQGYPISGEMQERSDSDGKIYTVQYFERSVFELHPENRPPYQVLLSLLGTFRYKEKYPTAGGAPGQLPSAQPNTHLFPETGKTAGGLFLDYWQRNGGLAQFGFPISDEFQERSDLDGKIYRVQYFQRAVFEDHPENPVSTGQSKQSSILLSQLGTFRYRARYAQIAMGAVAPAGSMSVPRACHSSTLLPDGRVLIVGGMQRDGILTSSAELYDPRTGIFQSTGEMSNERVCHSAMLLRNGKVLMAGGYKNNTAELFDPSAGAFSPTGNMHEKREAFTATLLQNGKVLVTGGYSSSYHSMLSSAELYDPSTGAFTPTGNMRQARATHTSTLLRDGRVLLTGGGADGNILAGAEIYDPRTGTFTLTASMNVARYKHAAALLPDGKVLVVGGSDNHDWRGRYSSAEVYDPDKGTFISTGRMDIARFKFREAVAPLQDGRLLVAGSGERVEVYDARTGTFVSASGQLDTARFYAAATTLSDGRVLITGGYDTNITVSAGAWIYKP